MGVKEVLLGLFALLYGAYNFLQWSTSSTMVLQYILLGKDRKRPLSNHPLKGSWQEQVGTIFFFWLEIVMPLLIGILLMAQGLFRVCLLGKCLLNESAINEI
jgi:hypothetical protein